MTRYESVFIMTPVLSEDQAAETVKKFKDYLTGKGAKMVPEKPCATMAEGCLLSKGISFKRSF